jgi:hypothetical protein
VSAGLVDLTVRLRTSRADRHITNEVHDLTFRTVVPGGFASCEIALSRPLTVQPDEIAYYGNLYVYDARNGKVVWEGRVEDPGRTADATMGEVWQVRAVGPAAHAQDREVPLVYVDTQLSNFEVGDVTSSASGQTIVATDLNIASGAPSVTLSFPSGTQINTNSHVSYDYLQLTRTGQKLARIGYQWSTVANNVNMRIQEVVQQGGLSPVTLRDVQQAPGTHADNPKVVVTDFANGKNIMRMQLRWTGGAFTIPDDLGNASFYSVYVRALLLAANGTEVTTGYTANTVLASEVVADLLGRLLPKYDGANASIATTSYTIDHLAYLDGATPDKILQDLMTLEPAYYWAAWESSASTGLYRFEWSAWPTSIRYDAAATDGFDSPASAVDLYNQVLVRFIQTRVGPGSQTTTRTQTVQALDDAGLTRSAFLDLADEVGSPANAQQAGDQFLGQHQYPPNAGTLKVARPIPDYVTGRMVMPWEIRPGTLIRVRGVLPRINSLNATARDGVTVFRIVGVTYTASTATAELELDSYPVTVSRALATLAADSRSRRR